MPTTRKKTRAKGSHAKHARPQDVVHVPTTHAGRDPLTGKDVYHPYSRKTMDECVALAKQGADVRDIAVILDLRPGHVRMWYGSAIDRELALLNVDTIRATYHAAKGFSHNDTHIAYDQDRGKFRTLKIVRHYPPNVNAASFLLKNRQPESWNKEAGDLIIPPDEAATAVRERLKAMAAHGGVPEKDKPV